MEQAINNSVDFSKIIYKDLQDFCKKYSSDFSNFKDKVKMVDFKYRITKIPKFNLQINRFVYSCLVDFPVSNFIFETITAKNVFEQLMLKLIYIILT